MKKPQFELNIKGISEWYSHAITPFKKFGDVYKILLEHDSCIKGYNVDEGWATFIDNNGEKILYKHLPSLKLPELDSSIKECNLDEGWVIFEPEDIDSKKEFLKIKENHLVLNNLKNIIQELNTISTVSSSLTEFDRIKDEYLKQWNKLPSKVYYHFTDFIEPLFIQLFGEKEGQIKFLKYKPVTYSEHKIELARIKGLKLSELEIKKFIETEQGFRSFRQKSMLALEKEEIRAHDKYLEISETYKKYFSEKGIITPPTFEVFCDWWLRRPENIYKDNFEELREIKIDDFIDFHQEKEDEFKKAYEKFGLPGPKNKEKKNGGLNEYGFSVFEWATIFYFAESAKQLPVFRLKKDCILGFMEDNNINTTFDSLKNQLSIVKKRINKNATYPIIKLEKILPFVKENYPQAVTLIENEKIYLETEKYENE